MTTHNTPDSKQEALPRCPKCGYVMCEQFDSRPVNALADIVTPNGTYICYHCTPLQQEGEQENFEMTERTIDKMHRETGIPMWALEIAFELSLLGMLDEETQAGLRVIPDAARVIANRPASLPTTPSDPAMRAARELKRHLNPWWLDDDRLDQVAAIIPRHLAVVPNPDVEAFWMALERSWEIEPRGYFEEQAPKNGFGSPLAMAVHYMWKRETKAAAATTSPEKCIHCDPSFVPTGPDGYCYCRCHAK